MKYLESKLENFQLQYKLGEQTPGLSFLLQKNDEVLFEYDSGIRDVESYPINAESNFRLASISKQFTAACILQLIEKGLLTFDTIMSDLIQDFPAYGNQITIRHLLTHTSGIEDYEDDLSLIPDLQISDEQVLSIAKQKEKGMFAPGTQYHYSNGGYCILALIVQKISGLSFGEYLQKNIFVPTGMTMSCLNDSQIHDRVYGFSQKNDGVWFLNDQDKTSATQGDGGIYSSCRELSVWHDALYKSDIILSKKSREWMVAPHTASDEKEEGYGGGLFITNVHHIPCYRHGGSSIGFSNALFYLPTEDLTLCILSNLNGIDMTDFGMDILQSIISDF